MMKLKGISSYKEGTKSIKDKTSMFDDGTKSVKKTSKGNSRYKKVTIVTKETKPANITPKPDPTKKELPSSQTPPIKKTTTPNNIKPKPTGNTTGVKKMTISKPSGSGKPTSSKPKPFITKPEIKPASIKDTKDSISVSKPDYTKTTTDTSVIAKASKIYGNERETVASLAKKAATEKKPIAQVAKESRDSGKGQYGTLTPTKSEYYDVNKKPTKGYIPEDTEALKLSKKKDKKADGVKKMKLGGKGMKNC